MNAPKVLVYCPLSPTPPRIHDRTQKSIFTMYWSEPLDIVYGRADMRQYPESRSGNYNLLDKYVQARRLALEGGYDALLTVEADMIVPKIALERMVRVDADVIYGLYVSRHGTHHWLSYSYADLGFHGTSLSEDPQRCREAWGKAVDTSGIGLGCTLIWRRVLECIPFRLPDPCVANDWYFALDVRSAGFRQVHDCGVVCGHIDDSSGRRIYWPEPGGGYREEIWAIRH